MSTQIYSGTNEKDGKLIHDSEQHEIKPPKEAFKIVEYPNPALLKKSEPYVFKPGGHKENEEFISFCYGLFKCYLDMTKRLGPNVVGLAAPQCGFNVRVIIVEGRLLINPEVIWTPKEGKEHHKEGCLSLPLTMSWGVWRPYACKIKYQDMSGNVFEEKVNGMKARIILHEMDHLEGKLCCGEEYPKSNA